MRALYPIVSVLAIVTAGTSYAADVPALQTDSWYRVEVIIFERLAAIDATAAQETIVAHEPRAYPRGVLAFDDDASRAAAYPLDAETRAQPALPTMDPTTRSANSTVQTPAVSSAPPTAAEQAAKVIAEYQAQLQARSYRFESPNTFLLAQEGGRLQRSNAYRVVFHRAWIQPVPDRDQLLPMLIQAGERIDGEPRIAGTLGITRGRFLHLDARLWIANAGGTAPDTAALDSAATMTGPGYMELREQRRMRSGELHYLDHPSFGVLARIDPVLPPETLLAELARLGAPAMPGAAQESPAQ